MNRHLMLGTLVLLLAACSSSPTPGTGTGGTSTGGASTPTVTTAATVTGNVVIGGPGAGQATFQMSTSGTSTSDLTTVAQASVAADGSFTVTLPDGGTLPLQAGYVPQSINLAGVNTSCALHVTLSDPAARGNGISASHFSQGGVTKGTLATFVPPTDSSTTATAYSWVFEDRAVTVTGTADCTVSFSGDGTNLAIPAHLTYNLNFVKGWNVVKPQITIDASGSGSATGSVTSEALHGLSWYFSAGGS